ncbi:MAG: hypothetical protein HUK15_09665, partial [Bacteroidales bacterium]|nr:hypothetical protein [Bacteroidales bacterium]
EMERSEDMILEATDAMRHLNLTHSSKDLMVLATLVENMEFDLTSFAETSEERKLARRQQYKVDSIRQILTLAVESNLATVRKSLASASDELIEETKTYPCYLVKGSTLFLSMETSGSVTVKVHNADSRTTLKTYAGKKKINDSIAIKNGAIYLVEFIPNGNAYIDMKIEQSAPTIEELNKKYTIKKETIEAKAGDFLARKVNGIKTQNMFEEPKKLTLRSQGKAFFSGSARSVATLNVPSGMTDVLYNLRISLSETSKSSDGRFCDNVNSTYSRIKFLGLPIYERQGSSSSLLRELLNANPPDREEEAYCSVYVFTNAEQAKKFQDGVSVSDLKYNIDLSAIGTQSRNDRIPTKGQKTIYLGFENERFLNGVYLWLEAVGTMPVTEYYKDKYTVK